MPIAPGVKNCVGCTYHNHGTGIYTRAYAVYDAPVDLRQGAHLYGCSKCNEKIHRYRCWDAPGLKARSINVRSCEWARKLVC